MKIDSKEIQRWLSGEIFRHEGVKKQYPLVVMILVLTFFYIMGGYHSARQQRHLSDLKREVRDRKFEYLTMRSQLVDKTRSSALATELKERGSRIQEIKVPIIYVR